MTDVPVDPVDHDALVPVHDETSMSVAAAVAPIPVALKTENIDDPHDLLLHHHHAPIQIIPTKLEDINDVPHDLLVHGHGHGHVHNAAATQGHIVDTHHITNAEEEAAIVAAASEIVAAGDLNSNDPTGSILPSDLTAEVAASAAAVAASLNHQHNDLLLSSEIAQIAAESANDGAQSHEEHLASRRQKDRERYASMTNDQRESYNKKRREQYHRQTEESRRKRRERERNRYHALTDERAKERNARRAALERDRYKKLSPNELAARNAKRRDRASVLRAQKKAAQQAQQGLVVDMHVSKPSQEMRPPQVQQTMHEAHTAQMPTSTSELDMVRVYDTVGLNPDMNYETHNLGTEQIKMESIQVQDAPPIELPHDSTIPNTDDLDDGGVAV
jgi:hypothetical protein